VEEEGSISLRSSSSIVGFGLVSVLGGSFGDRVLEVLGWVGLVFSVLVVVGVLGGMVVALLFDWEYGLSVLLRGVVGISLGVAGACYFYVVWVAERRVLRPARFVVCPFCGMRNDVVAQFCVRCGKAFPEQASFSVHKRVDSD
jgi:MFS family permease